MKPSKLGTALAILDAGKSIFVHVNNNHETIRALLPANYARRDHVVLQLAWDMPIPIPDLTVSETGFSGTLSFNGKPFTCVVPWDVVFAVVGEDGKGNVWGDDMPQSVVDEMVAAVDEAKKQPEFKATKVPYLRVVK